VNALSAILREAEGGILMFWCPGCNGAHQVRIGEGGWGYNGDPARPTFTPSILVRSGHHVPGHKNQCWCKFNEELVSRGEEPSGFSCRICHSFVTNGRIQFLSDCTHALAGQTVDLPEFKS
jgi:hypothetical protein